MLTQSVISNDVTYSSISLSGVNVEIIDNETSGIQVVSTGGNLLLKENGESDTLLVSIPSIPSDTVFVTVAGHPFVDLGNGPGQDLTLVFPPNSTSLITKEVIVIATNDAFDYPDSTLFLGFSATSSDSEYDGISINDETVLVVDDDDSQVVLNELVEINEGQSGNLEIILTSIPFDTVFVTISPDSSLDVGNGIGNPIVIVILPDSSALDTVQITVLTVDDTSFNETQSGVLTYIVNSGDQNYNGFILTSSTVDIIEDEIDNTSKVLVQLVDTTTNVFDHTDTIVYVVKLKTAPSDTVIIEVIPDKHLTVTVDGQVTSDTIFLTFYPDATSLTGVELYVTVDPDGLGTGESECVIGHIARSGDVVYDSQTKAFTIKVNEPETEPDPERVKVKNTISPNGDGYNDYLHIDNASQWEEVWISVYSRSGSKVFSIGDGNDDSANRYVNGDLDKRFNGTDSDGEGLTAGMYVYVVRMLDFKNGKLKVIEKDSGTLFIAY